MKLLSYLHRKSNPVLNTLIVDDHPILLEGVERVVNELDGFSVLQTSTNVSNALEKLKSSKIELLITDYNLPDDSGLTLIREAKKEKPSLKIIMLSMHDEAHLVKEVLKEGIDGYVLKKDTLEDLSAALKAVKNGKVYLSSDINSMLVQNLSKPETPQLLTSREREILQLISEEHSNKSIGEKLFISERTVETHRKNIFRKTKTTSLVGLIKFAFTNNLVDK